MSANNYGLPSPLTAQAIFDKVATHLLRQGYKSLRDPKRGLCGYRGKGGEACAVGVLIADDVYDPYIEGAAAFSVVETHLPELLDYKILLQSLQDAHDEAACDDGSAFDRLDLIGRLRVTAVRYQLSLAILDSAEPAQPWTAPQVTEQTPPLPSVLTRFLAAEREEV